MLSDRPVPFTCRINPHLTASLLRIDWIDIHSFANELDVCMYAGANKLADGSLKGWRDATKIPL